MTIAIGQVGTVSAFLSTAGTTASKNTSATGSAFVIQITTVTTAGQSITWAAVDSFTNNYIQTAQKAYTTGGATTNHYYIDQFRCANGVGGTGHTATATPTITGGGSVTYLIALIEITGAALTDATLYGAASSLGYSYNNPGPYASTSLTLTPPASGAVLISGFCSVPPASGTVNESTGFTVEGQFVSAADDAVGIAVKVVTSAGTYTPSWQTSVASYEAFTSLDSFLGLYQPFGEGSSSGATSAATGTNGGGMAAIVAGNQLDVLVHITNSTAPTAMTISDGHNTYNAGAGQFGSIDVFNDSGNGQIWYRFRCSVTVPLTTPVITATAQAGYFPTNMSIFAGILTGIATGNPTPPLTAANVAHSSVITGPNQVSGFTPVLAAGPGINYTASAFAMDVGASFPVGAPTAGNNFTKIATAWAFISSGGTTPTLLWETMAIPSGGAATQATAVYQSGRPYTLLAVFNNLAGAINPAGPMPRQLYIMP